MAAIIELLYYQYCQFAHRTHNIIFILYLFMLLINKHFYLVSFLFNDIRII